MHKKPTQPFGYIAFGKDGTVRKHIETLAPIKEEQEAAVACKFAAGMSEMTRLTYVATPLKENDHDFLLRIGEREIIVQATEIVGRDYLRPISTEEHDSGKDAFSELVYEGRSRIFGVDNLARDSVLTDRIRNKHAKHYSKGSTPLWLLVWTVRSDFRSFWCEGGKFREAHGITSARTYLAASGSAPFEEIWLLQLPFRPRRIWPNDNSQHS